MKKCRLILGINQYFWFGVFVFSSSWALAQSPTIYPGNPLKGWQVFSEKGCISCHQFDEDKNSIGPKPSNFVFQQGVAEIAARMWNHAPLNMLERMQELGMKPPEFTLEEMNDLLGFLYFFNHIEKPGDSEEGEKLFRTKACANCHQDGGKGPELDLMNAYASPVLMLQSMWNHGEEMVHLSRKSPERSLFLTGEELIKLWSYIRANAGIRDELGLYATLGDARNGEEVFAKKKCIACHGSQGRGTVRGPKLSEPSHSLKLRFLLADIWKHWPDHRFRQFLPGRFEGDEMVDLVAYLHTLRYNSLQGSVKNGEHLFTEKSCVFCHQPPGQGGGLGPDLLESEHVQSPIFLVQRMWNHIPTMKKEMAKVNIRWIHLNPQDFADLQAYLQKQAKKKNTPEK